MSSTVNSSSAAAATSAPVTVAPSTAAETTPPNVQEHAKAKPISQAAKAELRQYFTRRQWPRNKTMPKVNVDGGLDDIINKHGLKRNQASRQLRNWKAAKYDNSQVSLIHLKPEDIKESICESISMELDHYVSSYSGIIAEGGEVPGCPDNTNLCQLIGESTEGGAKKGMAKFIHDNPTHQSSKIFVNLVEKWIECVVKDFPKRAKQLGDAELTFLVNVNKEKVSSLEEWKHLFGSDEFPLGTRMSKPQFGYFFLLSAEALFFYWCRTMVDDDRRAIEIPDKDLVAKYSQEVVYYVAGWTLQRASLAKTVGELDRFKYQQFATSHNTTIDTAKQASLPYELVELRQKKILFYASEAYFNFIRLVESIYIKNLTMSMMLAYADGDLVKAIDAKIKSSDRVQAVFFSLFSSDNVLGESDKLDIMHYVLERYLKMRGCWFVKHMKTNQGKSLGEVRVANAPTRTMVAHKHTQTKEKGAEEREQALWDSAKQNVIDFVNDDEVANENNTAIDDIDIEANEEY